MSSRVQSIVKSNRNKHKSIDISIGMPANESLDGGDFSKLSLPSILEDHPAIDTSIHAKKATNNIIHLSSLTKLDSREFAKIVETEAVNTSDPELQQAYLFEVERITSNLGSSASGQDRDPSKLNFSSTLYEIYRQLGNQFHSAYQAAKKDAQDTSLSNEKRCAAWIEAAHVSRYLPENSLPPLHSYLQALELCPKNSLALYLATDAALTSNELDCADKLLERQLSNNTTNNLLLSLWLRRFDAEANIGKRKLLSDKMRSLAPHNCHVLHRVIHCSPLSKKTSQLRFDTFRALSKHERDSLSRSTALHHAVLLADSREKIEQILSGFPLFSDEDSNYHLIGPALELVQKIGQSSDYEQLSARPEYLALLDAAVEHCESTVDQAVFREERARIKTNKGESNNSELINDLKFCSVHLPESTWAPIQLIHRFEQVPVSIHHSDHPGAWIAANPNEKSRTDLQIYIADISTNIHRNRSSTQTALQSVDEVNRTNKKFLQTQIAFYQVQKQWDKAIASLQKLSRICEDNESKLFVLRELAECALVEVSDVDIASKALDEIVRIEPEDWKNWVDLAEIAKIRQDPDSLVSALEGAIQRIDEPEFRISTEFELGEILIESSQNQGQGMRYLESVISQYPAYSPAAQLLAETYKKTGKYKDATRIYHSHRSRVSDVALLEISGARIHQKQLHDFKSSIESLQRAYERNFDLVPLKSMLVRQLEQVGRFQEAYDLLRTQDPSNDPNIAADLQYHLGVLAESCAGILTEDKKLEFAGFALDHYRASLALDSDHQLAFEGAKRLLIRYHDHENLIDLLEKQLESSNPRDRSQLLIQLARIYAGDINRLNDSRQLFESAARLIPGDSIVERELEIILRRINDVRSLPTLQLHAARQGSDAFLRAALLVEAAEVLNISGNDEDQELAGKSVLQALRLDPGNPHAVRHLESLLANATVNLDVGDAVSARAVRAHSEAERAIFYIESAELLERCKIIDQAQRAYMAANEALPNLLPATLGLKRLTFQASQSNLSQSAAPRRTSVHDLLAQARELTGVYTQSHHHEDAERALYCLQIVVQHHPNQRDAIGLIHTIAQQLEDPKPAIELLSAAFPRISDHDLRYEIALFLGEQQSNVPAALTFFQAALACQPSGKKALIHTIRCLRELGDHQTAASTTEKLLSQYHHADPVTLQLRTELALMLNLNDETRIRAIEHIRTVIEARPEDARALVVAVDILEKDGQFVEAARTLNGLLVRERDRESLHSIYLRQAKLLASAPSHDEAAISSAEKALLLKPEDFATIELFLDLLGRRQQIYRIEPYLPQLRAAFNKRILHGEFRETEFELLSRLLQPFSSELSNIVDIVHSAIFDSDKYRTTSSLTPATRDGIKNILRNSESYRILLSQSEHPILSTLLHSLELIASDLGEATGIWGAEVQLPPIATQKVEVMKSQLSELARSVGIRIPTLHSRDANHLSVLLSKQLPEIHISNDQWEHGDTAVLMGFVSLALSRHALACAKVRALSPEKIDLIIAACFEIVGVFNAITADPDPMMLADLVEKTGKLLAPSIRAEMHRHCQNLATTDIVPGQTGRAIHETDLRMAVLISGDVASCLAAACSLDGVSDGPLATRIERSEHARTLLSFVLSEDFVRIYRISSTR